MAGSMRLVGPILWPAMLAAVSVTAAAERPPIDRGYLFSEGEYLPPPYVIRQDGDEVQVNGRLVLRLPSPGAWRELLGPSTAEHWLTVAMANTLANDGMVLVHDHSEVLSVVNDGDQQRLVEAFAGWNDASKTAAEETLVRLAAGFSTAEAWRQWVRSFAPPSDLTARAAERMAESRAVMRSNERRIEQLHRVQSALYVLTMAALALSVFALGHLLSWHPPQSARWSEIDGSAEAGSATAKSLALIVLLSGFDLYWTLRAAGGASFCELNPIGSGLLSTPGQMTLFKATAIATSCLLLLKCRRYRGAQKAVWWMCLVCTLITFRWLMFESMFLS